MNSKINSVAILIGLIVVVAMAGVAWRSYQMGIEEAQEAEKMAEISNFEECIAAGYMMIRSNPRQCEMPNGTTFVDTASPPADWEEEENRDFRDRFLPQGSFTSRDAQKTGYTEYTSRQGEVLRLVYPVVDEVVTMPLTVGGEVPGYWSFEGDFPIVLTDWNGLIIGEGVAQLEGEWMTEEYVPFTATIEYERPTVYNRGYLILQRNNPSGLSENDDDMGFRVYYEEVAE